MSLRKSKRAGASGATEPLVLVLDTPEGFFEEADNALAKVVYLTGTSTPPAEPAQGRESEEYCAVLSFKLTAFDVACYIEPLGITALDMAAASEQTKATIEQRLTAFEQAAGARGLRVRRGRWQFGGFEEVTR